MDILIDSISRLSSPHSPQVAGIDKDARVALAAGARGRGQEGAEDIRQRPGHAGVTVLLDLYFNILVLMETKKCSSTCYSTFQSLFYWSDRQYAVLVFKYVVIVKLKIV
jgi:hypothetical protein